MKTALLVGNDINNLSPGYSWETLLKELINFVGGKGNIKSSGEQFPLLYEEIWAYAEINKTKSEFDIKEFISEKVQKIKPNVIHEKLACLPVTEILTTNYEFTLEESVVNEPSSLKNTGAVSEQKYSLFRHFKFNEKRFWHIHGDANHPQSIALGYEQYSGYLQNMRNYMVSGTKDTYKSIRLESLIKRLKTRDHSTYSWIDLFFSHDIHILGLGLDFVEIHLWWLLTYRARVLNGHKLPRRNKIFYYSPTSREEKDKIKHRFLRAYGVTIREVDDSSGKDNYYSNVISKIDNHFLKNHPKYR